MILGDVVLDPLLEFLSVTDSFDGVALGTGMDGYNAAEIARNGSPVLNRDINPLVTAFLLDSSWGKTKTALKCRPYLLKVTILRENSNIMDWFSALVASELDARENGKPVFADCLQITNSMNIDNVVICDRDGTNPSLD